MVAQYTILGQKVGSHVLAMATLGTTGFVGWYATRGGPKEQKDAGPPINATSKDEESFIQEFLKSAEAEDKKAKAKH